MSSVPVLLALYGYNRGYLQVIPTTRPLACHQCRTLCPANGSWIATPVPSPWRLRLGTTRF